MRIRVKREYSGEEGGGTDKTVAEGSEHNVSRQRGEALAANGLVEVIDDADEPGEKSAPEPANKAAPKAKNKAAAKAKKKA